MSISLTPFHHHWDLRSNPAKSTTAPTTNMATDEMTTAGMVSLQATEGRYRNDCSQRLRQYHPRADARGVRSPLRQRRLRRVVKTEGLLVIATEVYGHSLVAQVQARRPLNWGSAHTAPAGPVTFTPHRRSLPFRPMPTHASRIARRASRASVCSRQPHQGRWCRHRKACANDLGTRYSPRSRRAWRSSMPQTAAGSRWAASRAVLGRIVPCW